VSSVALMTSLFGNAYCEWTLKSHRVVKGIVPGRGNLEFVLTCFRYFVQVYIFVLEPSGCLRNIDYEVVLFVGIHPIIMVKLIKDWL